jgi:hypothetical protein
MEAVTVQIESKPRAKALKNAMKMMSNQVLTLDGIFSRMVKQATPATMGFHQDMRTALKAQAQYRATLKILLALEAAGKGEEKTQNSREQTIAEGDPPT